MPSAVDTGSLINELPQYELGLASTMFPCNLETLAGVWERPSSAHTPRECDPELMVMVQVSRLHGNSVEAKHVRPFKRVASLLRAEREAIHSSSADGRAPAVANAATPNCR